MVQVYFLCTGNACRSQMAEGFAKQILGDHCQIASAGIECHGLDPRAVQVMAERGIDISNQYSKRIDINYLRSSDLIVTLCGDARDRCPVVPNAIKKEHWPLNDPAQAVGNNQVKLAAFRHVRDQIESRISDLAIRLRD